MTIIILGSESRNAEEEILACGVEGGALWAQKVLKNAACWSSMLSGEMRSSHDRVTIHTETNARIVQRTMLLLREVSL